MSRLELVGQEDLVYGDLEDVLGAYELIGRRAGKPSAMRSSALQAAAVAKMAQAGLVVKETQPTKARRLYLPMSSPAPIAPGASFDITGRSQAIAFKPQKVVVPASIAPDFTIDQILVGVKPQAVQTGSASAETFVADAFDVEMDMDTLQTSQDFVISVTNISGAARTFRATVYGRSADT